MIDWFSTQITEPPLTKSITMDQLEDNIKTAAMSYYNITSFPCHTQDVERISRVVTEASKTSCGPEKRDSHIRAKLVSRQLMPVFETKHDYAL